MIGNSAAKEASYRIALVFASAMLLRLVLSCLYQGCETDMVCFYAWSVRIYEVGFGDFYSEELFADYPPGYLYVLYPIGMLIKELGLGFGSKASCLLLKLPAVIFDMITGAAVYNLAVKKHGSGKALLFSSAYLFNPAVIYNSAVWGQVDSVYTFAVVLMCILLYEKKPIQSYFVFAAGILIKPQMLMFTPLLLWGIYENVFSEGFDKKYFLKNLLCGLSAIGCMAAACLPFGISKVLKLYITTMDSYEYATVNAYNFWALLGKNWRSQDDPFIGVVTFKQIGMLVISAICVFSALILFKRRKLGDRYWVSGAFIISTMFVFSVRMHERYLFPAMILLLIAYIANGDRRFLRVYAAMSLLLYLNLWHVLKYFGLSFDANSSCTVQLISLGILLTELYFYQAVYRLCKGREQCCGSP